MKRKLFSALFAAACLLAASCNKDDDNDIPNENDNAVSDGGDTTETYKIDFSDLTLEANSHCDSGKFSSGKAVFLNSYDPNYGTWGGFAYSNQNDTSASGYTAQFDVYTSTPSDRGIFAVGYMDTYTPAIPTVTFDEPVTLKSAELALNAYAYKSMMNGDAKDGEVFAKKFAAGDWYKITIKSVDSSDVALDSLDVYLADFRDGKSVLIDHWAEAEFSLAPLAAGKFTFEASSSDTGMWGMNTPAYFCIDNIVVSVTRKK
ncbi:MAG: DUF4465 domain-containing protein [Prevotellaceae bacterium]|jgi:hypothetical protein|nr:DUF4465 domain-containing protein [Prevotellaceae bacterium]